MPNAAAAGQGLEMLGDRGLTAMGNAAGNGQLGQMLGRGHQMASSALGGDANVARTTGGLMLGAGAAGAGAGAYGLSQMMPPGEKTASYFLGARSARAKFHL
jgi:hypothetical protein